MGWDEGRIRWMSQPHIPTGEVWDAVKAAKNAGSSDFPNDEAVKAEVEKVFAKALSRVGNEELWLFRKEIRGEKDIYALPLTQTSRDFLVRQWGNRLLIEYEKDKFVPSWTYHDTRAWNSCSEDEKKEIEALFERTQAESEAVWEKEGEKILSSLQKMSKMLPCAEDLGAVPSCVPHVLKKLGILGLRVVRWTREYGKEGDPYIPLEDYPEASVCTPAVHDCSTLRAWWETEAGQDDFCRFLGLPFLPKVYNPGAAKVILSRIAGSSSRFRVFQIQDLLHLSPKWYAADPASERINVPGTHNEFNWTYRLPAGLEEIGADEIFCDEVKELAAVK
jgi:4-alpha-glucanotransferase